MGPGDVNRRREVLPLLSVTFFSNHLKGYRVRNLPLERNQLNRLGFAQEFFSFF
jgi:hypothetical protein